MTAAEETAGLEDIWYLKEIQWKGSIQSPNRNVKIITQNFNGPCSFIAICNILILRNHICIEPYERATVSYEYLSNLVAEYLLTNSADGMDPSSALSILPSTCEGMDLNPLFTDAKGFRPAKGGGELKLFQFANIELFHGWLVDPTVFEYDVLSRYNDYDSAVNVLVFADHLTNGQLVRSGDDYETTFANIGSELKEEDKQKVEDALVIRNFLEKTSSQLTYTGLFHLANALEAGALVALFRASHLSVLYKSPFPERPGLFSLVTDQVFAQEPSVVWELLQDVEGGASTFVDSDFVRSSPAGGDFAGRTAEAVRQSYDMESINADEALARQLQREEQYRAQQWEHQQRQAQASVAQQQRPQPEGQVAQTTPTQDKKKCIIT